MLKFLSACLVGGWLVLVPSGAAQQRAPQRAPARDGNIILNERNANSGILILVQVPALHEEAARIAKNFRFDDHKPLELTSQDIHRVREPGAWLPRLPP